MSKVNNDLKCIKIWLDENLKKTDEFEDLHSCLIKNNVDPCVERLPVENSIMWSRIKSFSGKNVDSDDSDSNTVNFDEIQLNYIIIKVEFEHFEKILLDYESNKKNLNNELFKYIKEIKTKTNTNRVTFALTKKIEDQLNGLDKKFKTKLNKKTLSSAYFDLQLNENVQIKILETKQDFSDFIFGLTKSIADYPNRCDNNDCEFLLTADSNTVKTSAKVDKNGEALLTIWANMLEKFQLVNKDQAYAIVSKYPTFYSLMTSYKSLGQEEGKLLLADIQVRRGVGVLSNVRRIGPELSKKIYQFFTSNDSNHVIVNDDK